jgi:hypothetical protein
MQGPSDIDKFICKWAITGGSELANAQSSANGLCALLCGDAFRESQFKFEQNNYVIERFRVICLSIITRRSMPGADIYLALSLAAKNANEADV